jgi:hypothetical protein
MDIYDGADWTEMDIDDLKAALKAGPRSGKPLSFFAAQTASTTSRKCAEFGLKPKAKS